MFNLSHNKQNQYQAPQSTQAPTPQQTNMLNGVAQPMDPMAGGTNFFDTLASKQPGAVDQSTVPTNQQGLPLGAGEFTVPTPQQAAPFNPTAQPDTSASPESGSPMDKWLKPVDNGLNTAGTPTSKPEVSEPFQSVFASMQHADALKVVADRDFVGEIFTAETQQAFVDGDFSGMPALINAAVQQGVAMATYMSGKVVDKGLGGVFENFQSTVLPTLMNDHQLSNMRQDPAFNDFSSPSMQPMVQMATAHVKGMYPNASPAEIHRYAISMMKDMNTSLSASNFNTPTQQQAIPAETEQLTDMERMFS